MCDHRMGSLRYPLKGGDRDIKMKVGRFTNLGKELQFLSTAQQSKDFDDPQKR